jgi:hypothetical protein
MRIEQIAQLALSHVLGRIARRAALALAIAAFAIVALYYFTAAGNLALQMHFGALRALLIMGAIYAGAAALTLGILWMMRAKPAGTAAPALSNQRDMQIAMLVEAVMLGYSLARKDSRVS